jgi:hypothetical protein
MKYRTILVILAMAAGLAMADRPVLAQITITVAENGNGLFTNDRGVSFPLTAALLPDPGPGGLPAALTYGLFNPPGLVSGDLLLVEQGGGGTISDLVRFNPQQNGGSLVFYSTLGDGAAALADQGFPTDLYANAKALMESVGGLTDYTPTAGQPGFVTGNLVTYVIQSNEQSVVPEPSSLVLAGTAALAGLGLWAWRRRAASRVG